MALAIAGPLSRALGADLQTATRQLQGIELWRTDLAAGLPKGAPELAWNEDPAVEPRVFDLGAAGFMALRLFATYAERTDLELPDTVPALLELLDARAVALRDLATRHATLEDVFVHLTGRHLREGA